MSVPLILLPGMMCDARLFGPQINILRRERQVGVIDLVGSSSMEGLAHRVIKHAPHQFALAGLSMGGIVAMEVARQCPERIQGLALMDTNPLAEVEEVRKRRVPQMDRVNSGELFQVMQNDMKPNYLANGFENQSIMDLCMEMAIGLGAGVFCDQSLALRDRPDQSETLANFRKPSLVLYGSQDKLCPRSRHELMHSLLSNSKLHEVDGAGHLPTLEQPLITTLLLRKWLKEIENAA